MLAHFKDERWFHGWGLIPCSPARMRHPLHEGAGAPDQASFMP
ncbi:hypothetical protein RK21_04016 [Pseudomonas plecoglossicida]|nr:hypothetical protein RK21_04016 [Pseudomonas plecoglossicida]